MFGQKGEVLVPCIDVSRVYELLCTDIELRVIFHNTVFTFLKFLRIWCVILSV